MLALLITPAFAGDRAVIDVVGYSEDARYFAFEEFGIQDGSGFAYSNVYIVDLTTDSWVVGTPVRVQADDQETRLGAIRSAAMDKASEQITDLGIDVPADLVALNGDGVPDTDAQSLHFGVPGYLPGSVAGDYELRLSSFVTTAAAPCKEWFSVDPKGYALEIVDHGTARLIHRDGDLPRSRGCPTSYRVYGVALPFMAQSIADAVALISVYPGGFEGPDRRFIAVPLGL